MPNLRRVVFALAVLAILGAAAQSQSAFTLRFFQLDVNFDGDKHPKSPWGYVQMEYLGSADVLYFNLAVDGFWRIRNTPVLSPEGEGAPYVLSFGFDLGVPEGTKVQFLSYAAALTDAPLDDMPITPLAIAEVKSFHYRLFTGYGGEPIAYSPPPPVQEGGAAAGPKYEHEKFPNQLAKKNECVPAAVSNSVQWLNDKYKLGIPPADITIDKMKVATGWDKTLPGCDDNWPQKKKTYFEENKIPITTDTISPLDFHKVEEAIKNGCDVEVSLNKHTAAVTGIQKLAPSSEPRDPDWALIFTHDADQNGNRAGLVSEKVKYDRDFGQLSGQPWVENKDFDLIVVECPITPTPTPSNTPPPSNTPTPSETPTPIPPSPSATATPVPPSVTPTPPPTNTPVSPSPSPSATPLTPTPPPTNTPIPPSPSATPAPTP